MKTIQTAKGEVKLPCFECVMVNIDQVQANNYNPNNVPENNMKLLEQSIIDNGFCFPVVTIYSEEDDKYVIVDGFHRYTIFKDYLKAKELPVVVLDQDVKQRMSATVQFNRARGVHQVELMGDLVKGLIEQGMSDQEISKHLGMGVDEVMRLKQITGVAELFKNQIHSKAWHMTKKDDSTDDIVIDIQEEGQ